MIALGFWVFSTETGFLIALKKGKENDKIGTKIDDISLQVQTNQ